MNLFVEKKYISFDLYDTLIFRTISDYHKIFNIVETNSKIKGFAEKRIHAEKNARLKSNDEIKLDDIYKYIDLKEELKLKLETIEIETEIKSTTPNQVMINILNHLRNSGKKIVITTDMYLPLDTIKKILEKNQIYYDYLFLSSENGVTKRSGKLFDVVMKELNCLPTDIVHIGDNYYTDKLPANKKGIATICRKSFNINLESNKSLYNDYYNSVMSISNYNERLEFNSNRIGYELLGPYLYYFCKWIHKKKEETKSQKLLFVSREGYFIKQIYDEMYPEDLNDSEYVHLNRNVLRLPFLKLSPTIDCFLSTISKRDQYAKDMLLDMLNLSNSIDAKKLFDENYNNDFITREEIKSEKFKSIFNKILDLLNDEINQQTKLVNDYFKQIGLLDNKCLLINNSFNGTGQAIIEKVLPCSIDNLMSLQFALTKQGKQKVKGKTLSWFDEINISKYQKELFMKECLVLEHLLFLNTGSSKRLILNDKNEIEAICEDNGLEQLNCNILNSIQSSALKFVKEYNDMLDCSKLSISKMINFLNNPNPEYAIIIGNLYDKDIDGTNLLVENYDFSYKTLFKKSLSGQLNYKWTSGYLVLNKKAKKFRMFKTMRNIMGYITKNRW